ncbi:hypothetical protein [Rhodococcus sp. YH1]|uniref:hypothetical protein n=1 Tax=Rhodococcus sp. YH1 TaxID=89066 RepID=UPI001386A8F7|nr:hypothetical protein [Rhodococcus sp. YH1]
MRHNGHTRDTNGYHGRHRDTPGHTHALEIARRLDRERGHHPAYGNIRHRIARAAITADVA